jgi:histone acetyltransferase
VENIKTQLLGICRKLREQAFAWPYTEPVSAADVPDYYDVIKNPRDISTMEGNIRRGEIKSKTVLKEDILLMAANSMEYNQEGDTFHKTAEDCVSWVANNDFLFRV